jgi:hypothetical protein
MHLTPPVALSHSIEYYRFMALKATNDTDGLPSKLAPSYLVDQLWHTHLLDTRSYAALEKLLLQNDGRLHHNPILVEQPDYEERLDYTRLLYYDVYHSAPPPDIWGEPQNDIGEEVKGETLNIFVHYGGYDPLHMKVNKNSRVETVIVACRKFFKISSESICFLLFHSRRFSGNYLPYQLQDNDRLDLQVELRGC